MALSAFDLESEDFMLISERITVRPMVKKPGLLANTILLLGSTGTGKSNFIECLSGRRLSGISKNQLEGFTQTVTAYEVSDYKYYSSGSKIFLIDAPGFADRKISELRILQLIREWKDKNMGPWGMGNISYILYFDRITDTRVPGSKRRLMSLFKQLTGKPARTAKAITIVTTMWDELWNDSQRERAEKRYQQMQDEHWKELLDNGAQIVKFHNTPASAVEVLHKAKRIINFQDWVAFDSENSLEEAPFGHLVQTNLEERIDGLQQRLRSLEDEAQQESSISNAELMDVILKEKSEVEADLHMFEKELEGYMAGRPLAVQPTIEVLDPVPKASSEAVDPLVAVKDALGRTKDRFKQLWGRDGTA